MGTVDPPELQEDVDLDMERRRYVLDAYARLEQMNHYQLLGVPRTADKKAVKRAYFGLAATIHPDRFFGKKLGSYKAKMEALFARVTMAYELLTDKDKRAAYDATLPPPTGAELAAPQPAGEAGPARDGKAVAPPKPPIDPKTLARRQEAMEALKARFSDAKGKVRQLAETAARARAADDLAGAAEAYRQALSLAPNDAELRAAYDDVQRGAAAKLAEGYARKAQLEERFGQWAQAAESWQHVVEARPADPLARERLANARSRARL